ncbi:lysophospholipase [Stenotrophomonas panacihumi]|uniref:Lysophospholipase n=1 Tax=Stenotrophomonas panacihumi TaxID=676599 RepID=A0A0R0ABJ5_9GAMM|nr:SGNH/GDSL hydrolase family protein [Stenotrophomonas panacihumi]KRG42310.1 lysophospholipase [Stenotrophomonas panacihumi]PTN53599.1 SGNH/GDSL hydrolase family protein [Stenotrophomonas panacihumi]
MSGAARFLALGDSYTIGEGVAEDGRWPAQLAALLRDEGIAMGTPDYIATTGWTTDELRAGIAAAAPVGPYALVSLGIGVNNQYRGWPLDTYRAEFAALLGQAIAFAGGQPSRVVVVSIPDWGRTPFARQQGRDAGVVAREIDAFNAAAADICAQAGVAFVEITEASRAQAEDIAMLADDGLHPSAAMYAHWARQALPPARRALSA